jgi:hypothetical protein
MLIKFKRTALCKTVKPQLSMKRIVKNLHRRFEESKVDAPLDPEQKRTARRMRDFEGNLAWHKKDTDESGRKHEPEIVRQEFHQDRRGKKIKDSRRSPEYVRARAQRRGWKGNRYTGTQDSTTGLPSAIKQYVQQAATATLKNRYGLKTGSKPTWPKRKIVPNKPKTKAEKAKAPTKGKVIPLRDLDLEDITMKPYLTVEHLQSVSESTRFTREARRKKWLHFRPGEQHAKGGMKLGDYSPDSKHFRGLAKALDVPIEEPKIPRKDR